MQEPCRKDDDHQLCDDKKILSKNRRAYKVKMTLTLRPAVLIVPPDFILFMTIAQKREKIHG
jgi:hypothetical protein